MRENNPLQTDITLGYILNRRQTGLDSNEHILTEENILVIIKSFMEE